MAHNNEAACGGILRNSDGIWLGGFSKKVGKCKVLTVELWGIYEGLKLAQVKGYNHVEVQVDIQEAVNIINGSKIMLRDMRLIRQIKACVNTFTTTKILKIHRKTNKSADMLAKHGLKLRRFY